MYKLIALDMDGTLLNENKEISIQNKEAIFAARKLGVKVVLASGRPLKGVLKYVKELQLDNGEEYTAVFNGSLVQNNATGEIISKTTLTLDDYKSLYEVSKDLGVHIHALTDHDVITPIKNEYTDIEANINGISQREIPIDQIKPSTTIVKVMMVDAPENIDRIIKELPCELHEKYTIVRSAPIFLEFLHKSVNKSTGIEKIAEKLNIKRDEIICVGDAGNDLHMINYAGLGVAMGNAFDEVKEAADFITLSNDENGVAHVIEKFILDVEKTA
ncbi:sugar-phosphatase [Oceanirhabdus sp. W0125-5]|uniref:sugar-phosphatase n=1 Tax=Oceanirhabdus sp. W0125-5 TaxID=2999116 RepID=UPI0022F31A92|nr:sugar-phosphatase [Oceanirhabdus sp. W0125-5]WBW95149.1 sugar-phosphatase [Oceanirhabdus sp. W0125-5]